MHLTLYDLVYVIGTIYGSSELDVVNLKSVVYVKIALML